MRILGIDPLVDGAAQANPLALAIIVDKLFLEVARSRSATFTKDFRKVLAPGMAAGMEMPWNHQGTPARVQLPDQGRGIWWFTEILLGEIRAGRNYEHGERADSPTIVPADCV